MTVAPRSFGQPGGDRLDREPVTLGAQAGDRAVDDGRHDRHVPPAFARVRIGEVHFDLHSFEHRERVGDRVRVVRERARVDHDRRAPAARAVDRVDERAFVVRLHVLDVVTELGGGLARRARRAPPAWSCRSAPARARPAGSGSVRRAAGSSPSRLHSDCGQRLAHRARIGIVHPFDPVRTVEHEREPTARLLVARHDREEVVGAQPRRRVRRQPQRRDETLRFASTSSGGTRSSTAPRCAANTKPDRDRFTVQQRVTGRGLERVRRPCGRS